MKSGLRSVCTKYLYKTGRSEVGKMGPYEVQALSWKHNDLLADLLNKQLAISNKNVFIATLLLFIFFCVGSGISLASYYLNLSEIIKWVFGVSIVLSFLFVIRWLYELLFEKSYMKRLLTLAEDISPNQITFIIEIIDRKWSKNFIKKMLSRTPKLSKNLLTRKKLTKKQEFLYEYRFLQTRLQDNEAILILTEKGVIWGITRRDKPFKIENNFSQLTKLIQQHANWLRTFACMRATLLLKETIQPIEKVTVKKIKEEMENELWYHLKHKLNNINSLHIISYGKLSFLPYELGAPDGLIFNNYTDLTSYYRLRHKTTIPYSVPRNDAPLGVDVYDAATLSPEIHIPLVNAEARMVQDIWPVVYQPVDVERGKPIVAFLHLSGHGQEDTENPGTFYLLLGERELSVENILLSPLSLQVIFLSACLLGKPLEENDGLISAFFQRGGEYVIAPTIPVPDFYMPLLTVLFHQAWQKDKKHNPHLALIEAKYRFRKGEWYEDTESIVRRSFRLVLLEHFKNIATTNNFRRWEIIRRNWLLPEKYIKMNDIQFNSVLEDELQDEEERHKFCEEMIDTLCEKRKSLDINNFSFWVTSFGHTSQ